MSARILVVEDEAHIRMGLVELLSSEGYAASACDRGDVVESVVRSQVPDLIVLDVMLPGLSGYDVCRNLRKAGMRVPILMLTAKGQELDKVIGLDLGADDYVAKPFGVRELLARIAALLRRTQGSGVSGMGSGPWQMGGCTVDPRTFRMSRGDCSEELTARELRLLQIFQARPGEVLSREVLLREVWGQRYFGTTRALDQVIVALRRKLGDSAESPRHLHTVHGVGYRFLP